ncbi:MAG: hypothetical protein LUP99_02430 [Methanomicrobiales archaeon]|nr:hypothetical protein [Methanomicrobiales archaeon]
MKKIEELSRHLITLLGEDIFCRELEGILKKHEGIAKRKRKPGRLATTISQLIERKDAGEELTSRSVARLVISFHLSVPSIYRLGMALRDHGMQVRTVEILKEMDRMKAGVF